MKYLGLDSETQDGRAVLLTTPTTYAVVSSWRECMGFLFAQESHDFILYNMNYDARALCAYLPKTVLRKLRRSGRADWRDYRIAWKGKKSFCITRKKTTVHMWDLYPFFDTSLEKAARQYLGAGKDDIPQEWYTEMAARLADPRTRDTVIRYGMRDAGLTQQLWEIVEKQCLELGITPHRAASPATLAKRAFAEPFRRLAACTLGNRTFQHSFFGGRTEIYWRGACGHVYLYDIHSAYPSVLARLPDPSACVLVRWDGRASLAGDDVAYGAYKVALHVPIDDPIPPCAFRPASGPLVFPAGVFATWVDTTTLRLLREYDYRHKVLYALEWKYQHERVPLFPDITRWYDIRRENPALKLAAKKVLNSLYGKTAERVRIRGAHGGKYVMPGDTYEDGRYWRNRRVASRHTCFAVAAAVTAGCREIVVRAMRQAPQEIVACHTDGIVSRVPLNLDFGPAMGQWGLDGEATASWVVGCGVGTYDIDGAVKDRLRGIPSRSFGEAGLREIFSRTTPRVGITVQHARTLHEARRSHYDYLNLMEQIPREIDVNMDVKRAWPRPWKSFREFACNVQRSEPIIIIQRAAMRALEGG